MISKLLRRSHLYLALFLTPWVAAYAVSTVLMVHHQVAAPSFSVERTLSYEMAFSPGMTPNQIAERVLADVGLAGPYNVSSPEPDGTLVITRNILTAPRRVTFKPVEQRVLIERADVAVSGVLGRLHRRSGYKRPPADLAMALSVDLFGIALWLWVGSGVWMWWTMRTTRRAGLVAMGLGFGIFAWLVVTV